MSFSAESLIRSEYRGPFVVFAAHHHLTIHADGRETYDVRNYILSRYLSGPRFGEAVRGDWGIESMHWVLDVNFREDDSRT